MDKNLYINDLIARNPGYTFTETLSGSLYTVSSKNVSAVVAEVVGLTLIDAYRKIRLDILNGARPVFLSTTAQRDALINVSKSRLIDNITLGHLELYTGAAWINAAGIGVMAPVAYGNLFEDSASGSAMDSTTKQWVTASAGVFDNNGLVSFLNHVDGDRLVIGAGGAGVYMTIASCGQTNSGSNKTTMTVHINDVDTTVIKDDQNANSVNHRALVANGILTLADEDYLTLHIADPDTPSNVIKVFDCHLTIQRIS